MTQNNDDLHRHLNRIDGRGYPAYKDIRGRYQFPNFTLLIDHVQGDPFAAPSRLRVQVPMTVARFPAAGYANRSRAIALRDFLARAFAAACRATTGPRRGSGKSGLINMEMPGQEILERSSIMITPDMVEARFVVGLPAQGRRILGRQAATILGGILPKIVAASLRYESLNHDQLQIHLTTSETADYLRHQLEGLGLVAFVADGSRLARLSGIDDRPLSGEKVVPFQSPPSLRVELTRPDQTKIGGMGLPKGVSLIIGGGYHGKSTLLNALERGVYNHIPGDGREMVLTDPSAVKIRAEDGRRVEGVNIQPFISHLPNGSSTSTFRTENASGSTSQAANILEALEVGCRALLLDEDTCATNLMIRDARMQALVEKAGEPITPFVDRVRQLAEEKGVSSILVLGGSGDYFDVADTVIRMNSYRPQDVTEEAKAIAAHQPTGRQVEAGDHWPEPSQPRRPLADSLDPRKGKRAVNIKGRALRAILFGQEEIDLSTIAQLVDEGQVRAIGQALNLARHRLQADQPKDASGEAQSLNIIVQAVVTEITQHGLDVLDERQNGDYVAFRPYELAAALNRLRTLRVRD